MKGLNLHTQAGRLLTLHTAISSCTLLAYAFVVFTLIPLAMPNGYRDLGEMKCGLFLSCSRFFLPILLYLILLALTRSRAFLRQASPLLLFSFLPLFFLLISTLLASDPGSAFNGSYGWRMGFLTFLIMTVSMLAFALLPFPGTVLYLPLLAGAAAASLVAAANRFGFDLMTPQLSAENRQDFLSTLGNINWLAGFLALTIPLAASLLFSPRRVLRLPGGLILFLLLSAAVLQGSNGILPVLAAILLLLFLFALSDKDCLAPFLTFLIVLGAAMSFSALMTLLLPAAYNGPPDNLLLRISRSPLGALLMGIGILFLFRKPKERTLPAALPAPDIPNAPEGDSARTPEEGFSRRAACLIAPTAFFLAVLLPLLLLLLQLSVTLPRSSGNFRGFIWHVGKSGFKKLPLLKKLFGVGPDCMGAYLYSLPNFPELLNEVYGSALLLNAHSLLLTRLLNSGFFGIASHLLLVSFALRQGCGALRIKKKGSPEQLLLLASLLGVVSYEIYMLFSFDQISATPLFYVLLGILAAPAADDGEETLSDAS
ncbi:MAG: O-antigen ligase family protein [Lachnospiraceae bacterium]|nr:O-antigen ligase family protein [Lachnospiraceae bacterium]